MIAKLGAAGVELTEPEATPKEGVFSGQTVVAPTADEALRVKAYLVVQRNVVRDYLDRFDPTYEGLVAPPGTVEEAAAALHVSFERPDGSTGGYEVDHGTHITAFLDGSARVVWSETTPVEDIRADLERLARLA